MPAQLFYPGDSTLTVPQEIPSQYPAMYPVPIRVRSTVVVSDVVYTMDSERPFTFHTVEGEVPAHTVIQEVSYSGHHCTPLSRLYPLRAW